MKRLIQFALSLALVVLYAAQIPAAEVKLIRKVDSFDILVDYSSKMNNKHTGAGVAKAALLEKALSNMNKLIPEYLGYPQSALHTFAPEKEVLGLTPYRQAAFQQGIQDILGRSPSGANTSLGNGLDRFGSLYSAMRRKGAVIVATDGEYSGGRDSINEAKIFYLTQPGLCLHFISLADSPAAQKLIDDMASISRCSVVARAAQMGDNPAAWEDFVRRVFYDLAPVETVPPPPPSAAVSGGTGDYYEEPAIDLVILSLPFAFDSDKLDERTVKVANAVAEKMLRQKDTVVRIDGYTCTMGPDAYNMDLSQRRANTVRNFLVNAGINPNRITTAAHGKADPRYGNDTMEGRSLNRRVEFTFSNPQQQSRPAAQTGQPGR